MIRFLILAVLFCFNIASAVTGYVYAKWDSLAPISGANVVLWNIAHDTVYSGFTIANGSYNFSVPLNFVGNLTAEKVGMSFHTYPYPGENYIYGLSNKMKYTIGAYSRDSVIYSFTGLTDTAMNINQTLIRTIPVNYSGTVSVRSKRYTKVKFSPSSFTYTNLKANQADLDYYIEPVSFLEVFSCSGYVKTSTNTPVSGVTVTYRDDQGYSVNSLSTTTNSQGFYKLTIEWVEVTVNSVLKGTKTSYGIDSVKFVLNPTHYDTSFNMTATPPNAVLPVTLIGEKPVRMATEYYDIRGRVITGDRVFFGIRIIKIGKVIRKEIVLR